MHASKTGQKKNNKIVILLGFLVLLISFFTYFRNYDYPPNLFWDENYHIASAQKYLQGVFFMEPHPPLGKMFIALGEYLIHPNEKLNTSSFIKSDYIKDVPANYSFAGVRFFPALFATLSAVFFFLILYKLSRRAFLSFLFTSFYLFENSFIVHSRGAMLESIQIFFILLLIWYFLVSLHKEKISDKEYAKLGILYGLVMAVKLNGITLGFLFVALFVYERFHTGQRKVRVIHEFLSLLKRGIIFGICAFIPFIASYYLHITIANTVVKNRYYEASQQYKKILDKRQTMRIDYFPLMFREHIDFVFHYEKGVPKFDFCKPGENGSLPVTWPFGDKSINYRWESGGGQVRYLYLQGNPFVWFFSLTGVLLALNLVVARRLFKAEITNKRLYFLIAVFLLLYLFYMGWVMTLERVMYLYHYFIPLIYSMFLFFLMFLYLFEKRLEKYDRNTFILLFLIVGLVFWGFLFFSPLSYYQPLTFAQFEMRNWFPFWRLAPVQ